MNARTIIHAVAEEAGLSQGELLGQSHRWRFAWPRQLAYLLLRERRGMSFPRIAMLMHRENWTTARDGYRAAQDRLLAVPDYRALHDRVVARLGALEAAE